MNPQDIASSKQIDEAGKRVALLALNKLSDILAKPGPFDAGDVARISAFATAAAAGVGAMDEEPED